MDEQRREMQEDVPFEGPEAAGGEMPEGAVEVPVEIAGDGGEGEDAAPAEPGDGAEPEPTVEELLARVAAAEAALEEREAALEKREAALEEQIRDVTLRSRAELENAKKRLARERDEGLRYAAEKVIKEIVPTLDNFELALKYGSKDEACAGLLKGLEVTQSLLLDALGRNGLSKVGEEGDAFDPAIHEAVGVENRGDLPDGAVARVLQSAYLLHGRLLRPARVNVNRR